MKVYLLAAGFATRMYPLTRDMAKPLLDVGGAPILSHIMRKVEDLPDLTEVVVVQIEACGIGPPCHIYPCHTS